MTWSSFRKQLIAAINEDDLRNLCFDLDIDYEALSGENPNAKIRELIALMRRQSRMPEFVAILKKTRPHIKWDSVLETAGPSPLALTNNGRLWMIGAAVAVMAVLIVIVLLVNNGRSTSEAQTEEIAAETPTEETETPTTSQTETDISTPAPPTNTPIPPTETQTFTPVPPTETNTPVPFPPPNNNFDQKQINGYPVVLVTSGNIKINDNIEFVHSFWIGQYEVTIGEFIQFLNIEGNICLDGVECIDENELIHIRQNDELRWEVDNVGDPNKGSSPITQVTWSGAQSFCRFIGGRLPTRIEWLKAAGWNPNTEILASYPWGDSVPNDQFANYGNIYGNLLPVGTFPNGRSLYGTFDMSGNVWEFIDSNETNSSNRQIVGGSWKSSQSEIHILSFRSENHLITEDDIGFRCAFNE